MLESDIPQETKKTVEPVPAPAKPDRTFKERIEQSAMKVVVVTIIATVTVSGSLQQYYYTKEKDGYQRKIDEAEAKFNSIQRGLTMSTRLDVRGLQYKSGDVASQISPQVQYFSDDTFYATKDQTWKFEKTNEFALMEQVMGLQDKDFPADFKKVAAQIPAYVWHDVKNATHVSGSSYLKNVGPFVMLEKLSSAQLSVLISSIDRDVSEADKKETNEFSKGFVSELITNLLAEKLLSQMESSISTGLTFQVGSIQKADNVLYTQWIVTMHNVSVNGVHYDKYYLRQELVLLGYEGGCYAIQTMIPSADPAPRGEAFANITKWFGDFHAVI
jgi:hypothetical protein